MTEGAGKIESSNFDGSERKTVVSGLHWPQGTDFWLFAVKGAIQRGFNNNRINRFNFLNFELEAYGFWLEVAFEQLKIDLQGIKVIPLQTSSGSGDNNVLLFTEALNGVIYEVDLGYLNDLPKEGKSAQDLIGDKDHVTVYNVTATNPKTQQFYMDVTLYEVKPNVSIHSYNQFLGLHLLYRFERDLHRAFRS